MDNLANPRGIYGILPARGGSKRISSKNTKTFHGQPIIQVTIANLKRFQLFNQIIVSTDSETVMSTLEPLQDLKIHTRAKKLSGDNVPTIEVVKDVIRASTIKPLDIVCCIYPTSIFIEKKYILDGFQMVEKNCNAIYFPIRRFPAPIERRLKWDPVSSKIEIEDLSAANKMSQHLKSYWYDISEFYVASAETWLKSNDLYSASAGINAESHFSIDINDYQDWENAEKLSHAFNVMQKSVDIGTMNLKKNQ